MKDNEPIKPRKTDPKLLNYLNYLNRAEKEQVVLPLNCDTMTGDLGKLTKTDFAVGQQVYYQHYNNLKGQTYWRVCKWYRWKPILFKVEIITVTERRGVSYPAAIKKVEEAEIATLFDTPQIEYERFADKEHRATYYSQQANLLDFLRYYGATPSPERVGRRRFNKALQALMNSIFSPVEPIDFDADGEEWYKKIIS